MRRSVTGTKGTPRRLRRPQTRVATALMLMVLAAAVPTITALPAAATHTGAVTATDVDAATVLVEPTHPPLGGGGQALWDGGSLMFPADSTGADGAQTYRTVAAVLSAPEPECHDGTVDITLSTRVTNDGPNDTIIYAGGFRLLESGDPADWHNRTIDEHLVTLSAPVGHTETLTVSAQVPAEDLLAGDVFAELDLETYHSDFSGTGNTGTQWTADQFQSAYEFGTEGCVSEIELTKTADRDALVVGETVSYTFVAENTGDYTLTDVEISDTEFSGAGLLSALECAPAQPAVLAPTETLECTATYTVEQADVEAGEITNTADVVGLDPEGTQVTDTDDVQLPGEPQESGLEFSKTADTDQVVAGETITYVFMAENTGSATLDDVTIDDTEFSGAGSLSELDCDPAQPATLGPGDVLECTATYKVQQADVDAGEITNVAVACAGDACVEDEAVVSNETGPGATPPSGTTRPPGTGRAPGSGPAPGAGPAQSAALARTGASLAWFALIAALFMGTGYVLVTARRRRLADYGAADDVETLHGADEVNAVDGVHDATDDLGGQPA